MSIVATTFLIFGVIHSPVVTYLLTYMCKGSSESANHAEENCYQEPATGYITSSMYWVDRLAICTS